MTSSGSVWLPPLFVSHGAPTLALTPGRTGPAWAKLGQEMPRPQAIVAVSAHWTTRQPALSSHPAPPTLHDFYGFPDALHALRYPAPGAPALAEELAQRLTGATLAPERGLDHGAWVPLSFLYPEADVPVIQLSVMPQATPEDHYHLGRALADLPGRGILVLASGSLTHNLGDVQWDAADGLALPYVTEFRDWFAAALTRGDLPALFDYRRQAPHAHRAHPSEEHLLPLYVALGAAGERPHSRCLFQETTLAALAMEAYTFTAGE
ncbi:DODA-type extradiol aromatic ring-opening family dioxygenase [Denitratisoma oestradiolicum]|uniref:4,5-DOPA dioxygenase extradiol n=1 Tax=Denitratisoma oestradiolicum TaxID=311182 RepID=A0A6S6XUB5_9PROT|nr:class III extradiol ring-cleavage dioxygenase [Denitratisoma oestradiolicum]TWO80501.1 dioxygenase [Denitratisoma oestradiolicum]CAB1367567.1 4,5-DOPA dioxygenase extradiol [Denitratisoma oestradiolicum]